MNPLKAMMAALVLPVAVGISLLPFLGPSAAIAIGHILFLCILRFAPVNEYIAARELEAYWNAEKNVDRQIFLPGKTYRDSYLGSDVMNIVQDPLVARISKAHFLTRDSIVFVEGYQADLTQAIVINIIIFLAIAAGLPDAPTAGNVSTDTVLIVALVMIQIAWVIRLPFFFRGRNRIFLAETKPI